MNWEFSDVQVGFRTDRGTRDQIAVIYWIIEKGRERICFQCGRPGFNPWVRKIPWRRKRLPTPVLMRGKFHGERSLEGYSPWGHTESDTTEHARTAFHLICHVIGLKNSLSMSAIDTQQESTQTPRFINIVNFTVKSFGSIFLDLFNSIYLPMDYIK